ncbi:glycerol kinase GlpK [Paludisphaera borealis]|uniref:ATP:glycerol 3-phosphotransferase n=1 Tax=Paludisphaera borealis TaxID=1387353 RepID=A0A1U7CMR2_9BACT|nr:glycerol kinase GlpK [Paludisphaera borealis]APW60222.1 Glycerol kinase [Paludisphaera borealis]
MARDHLLVIDQGTTSTRVILYDTKLQAVGQAQVEVLPTYPRSGWVEHDPEALIASVGSQVTTALLNARVRAEQIAAIGITNQRETTIVWDRETGRAIAPALVWQDRRTADACNRLRDKKEWISKATGLVIDPYFSATKIAWLLDNVPGARRRAEAGELAAGTVDTLVIRHLTSGEHLTDSTNASRTLLMDLATDEWSEELCNVFGVPIGLLAEIRPSTGDFGATRGLDYLPDGIPIRGVAGDQQASLVGQGCLHDGQAKCTYGTGAFLLAHTGGRIVRSQRGLITTRAASVGEEPPQYALEGSVFIAGAAVQWFRDGLKAIGSAAEIGDLALRGDPDCEVVFVPALTGLGAPHWEPSARGTIFGLTRATSMADIAHAVLEGVAFQIGDLITAIEDDLGDSLKRLRVDGGMSRSDPFLQFQADVLGQPIDRSPQVESTALGAALLAGVGIGLWPDREAAVALLQSGGRTFEPARGYEWRARALERWRRAVETTMGHYRKERR